MSQILEGFSWGWHENTDITQLGVSSFYLQKNLPADGNKPGISVSIRAHWPSPTPTPHPPPSAGGFTNEAKVNPGGLRAADKQHRVPLSEVFTPERAHICAVSLLHSKATHLNLTPDLWVRLKIRSSRFSDQEAEAQKGSALAHRAGGEARLEHRSPVMTPTPRSSGSLESSQPP